MTLSSSLPTPAVTTAEPVASPGSQGVEASEFGRAWSVRELAARLQVSVQTIYDLRSQGRGPRGFRIGRELRFRESEVLAWLDRLEEQDAQRHRAREPR